MDWTVELVIAWERTLYQMLNHHFGGFAFRVPFPSILTIWLHFVIFQNSVYNGMFGSSYYAQYKSCPKHSKSLFPKVEF